LTKALEERDVEVKVVLLRARDRELRLHGGLSTATRRWRDGGGRAAARGAALPAAGEQSRGGTCARKKKRGEKIRGTCLRFPESSRASM
jgi:hypothetical protein